jgi:radical SAM superfamily enzyme YgiQ (UPF0313 family)
VQGISYKKNGSVIVNPDRPLVDDLDELPMPRWDLLRFKEYGSVLRKKGFSGAIETSRGCLFQCHFCLVPHLWGHRQRFKSVRRVIEELTLLKKSGVTKLYFVDDNFGANRDRDLALCREIVSNRLDIEWMCFSRADYIRDNPDLYETAAKAGLRMVLTGFETMKTENAPLMNKGYSGGMSLQDYRSIYRFLKKNRIFTVGLFVIGYPQESVEDMRYTFLRYYLVCDYPLMTPFRPALPTKAYELAKDKLSGDMFYHDSQVRTLNSSKYIALHREFILRYFLHPGTLHKVFSPDLLTRSFFRAHYRHLVLNLCDANLDSLRDVFYILAASRKGKDFYKQKIVERYLEKYENIAFES